MQSIIREEADGFLLELIPDGRESVIDLRERITEGKNFNIDLFLSSNLNGQKKCYVKILNPTLCINKDLQEVDNLFKNDFLKDFNKTSFNLFLLGLLRLEKEVPFFKIILTVNIGKKFYNICVIKKKDNEKLFIGKVDKNIVFSSGVSAPAYAVH